MKHNPRLRLFAEAIARGASKEEAVKAAGYKARGAAARSQGSRLMANEEVLMIIADIQAQATSDTVMTVLERKEWLSRAIRTPLSEIDADDPLCVESTLTTTTAGSSLKIKKADPLKAIDILNRLDGDYAREEVKHKVIVSREEIAGRIRTVSPLIAGKLAMARAKVEASDADVVDV